MKIKKFFYIFMASVVFMTCDLFAGSTIIPQDRVDIVADTIRTELSNNYKVTIFIKDGAWAEKIYLPLDNVADGRVVEINRTSSWNCKVVVGTISIPVEQYTVMKFIYHNGQWQTFSGDDSNDLTPIELPITNMVDVSGEFISSYLYYFREIKITIQDGAWVQNVYFPTTGVSEGKKIVVYRTSSSSTNIIVNSQTIVINQYQTFIFVYTNGMWVSQSEGGGDDGSYSDGGEEGDDDGSYSGGEGTSDGGSGYQIDWSNTAIYADEKNNRILIVDYLNMILKSQLTISGGDEVHHVDLMGDKNSTRYIMVVPKKSEFVEFYDIQTNSLVGRINLSQVLNTTFKPRSGDAFNASKNLILLTASNRPAAVLIDASTLNVVGSAGLNISCNPEGNIYPRSDSEIGLFDTYPKNIQTCFIQDLGGSTQVTGHPVWLDDTHFAIIDRSNRRLHVYRISQVNQNQWNTTFVTSVSTETSLHQILKSDTDNNVFFGATEGNKIVYKPTIVPVEGEPNMAQFTLRQGYKFVIDLQFPTDSWGGLNQIIVFDDVTKEILYSRVSFIPIGSTSFQSRLGHTFQVRDDVRFVYSKWYENLWLDKIASKTTLNQDRVYKIFCVRYDSVSDYLNRTQDPLFLQSKLEYYKSRSRNMMHIVDYEVRFNNPNSSGYVPNMQSVTMDNTKYNDAKVVIAIVDSSDTVKNNQEPYYPSRLYKFVWDSNNESLAVSSVRLARYEYVGYLAHNISIDPKGKIVVPVGLSKYVNSIHVTPIRGGVFIVDKNLNVERFIQTGKGAGHVLFDTKRHYGLITHHAEEYVTVYDYQYYSFMKHIPLKINRLDYDVVTQSHSPFLDATGDYMYNFWTDGGTLFRINLNTLQVDSHKLFTDGMPIQGNYW